MDLKTIEIEDDAEWRSWLAANGQSCQGVWLVFRKKGAKSLNFDEAVDRALAYDWIESHVRQTDEAQYARKYTPRKRRSIWSSFDIARVKMLRAERRVSKRGLEAFAKRVS